MAAITLQKEEVAMAQLSKISKNNTRIIYHPDGSVKLVALHHTVIYESSPAREDGSRVIAISNGGYNTVTTQTRLNQIFNVEKLPIHYIRAGGVARVRYLTCEGYVLSAQGATWKESELTGNSIMLDILTIGSGDWLKIAKKCRDSFVVLN